MNPWRPEETIQAQLLRRQGYSYARIGRIIGRSESAVRRNLNIDRAKAQEEGDAI